MKKQELLNIINDELLEKLFGFCYARTSSSYEAQELCSDIVFELIKTANTDGEMENLYAFVWRIARNVYADFSAKRKQHAALCYPGDSEQLLLSLAAKGNKDNSNELLHTIYRRIAFLTKAYREVMILFYLDGLSTAEIAALQHTSEVAIRQRLFSAREKIRKEVSKMEGKPQKPVTLDSIDYRWIGDGNPCAGDPRTVCTRQFSKHILWLCRKKPKSAAEIAAELNVPTIYVEQELEILAWGENGSYGLLHKLESGKYIINFILLDKEDMEKATAIYAEYLPHICSSISDYIEKHKEEYLAVPYLNKKIDFNLILWQQIFDIAGAFSWKVRNILSDAYFSDVEKCSRPFSIYGYIDHGKHYGYGYGVDGIRAENVCGYSRIRLANIYNISRIQAHFHCGHDIANDIQIQLALRAIEGLAISTLSEQEKEQAAKAIECGYLYREGEMLYTKILASNWKDQDKAFDISNNLSKEYFEAEAQAVAEKIAKLIRAVVPKHLLGDWAFVNRLASLPTLDSLVEILIERGVLIPPKDSIGAEGCWVVVEK